jgi:hypothetical protein
LDAIEAVPGAKSTGSGPEREIERFDAPNWGCGWANRKIFGISEICRVGGYEKFHAKIFSRRQTGV